MNEQQQMGYEPSLDGIRAFSVIAVMLYHANIAWLPGGFLGVEVFFVVSGFLITSLLIEERESNGGIDLKQFWIRRARRLLPALFIMLSATAVSVAFFAKDSAPDFRRDVLPSLGYLSNWWQIFAVKTPYFAASSLPVLRHLWSLAVEEQWYLIWPLLFTVVFGAKWMRSKFSGMLLVVCSGAVMATTALRFAQDNETRTNFLYLSTVTRSSGLLLGAAVAMLWRPWRKTSQSSRWRSSVADALALASIAVIGVLMATVHVADARLYQGGLAATTVASAVVIAVVMRPNGLIIKKFFSQDFFVEVGRRSYGLYLWHWPIFVVAHARDSGNRFAVALAATIIINEFVYQFVEIPTRQGALGNWWRNRPQLSAMRRRLPVLIAAVVVASLGATGVKVVGIEARDLSIDTSTANVIFSVPTTVANTGTTLTPSVVGSSTTSTTIAKLPRKMVIVGDSQAHALAINKPSGMEKTFVVADGSIDGCGIYDRGVGVGGTNGNFRRNFANCVGFEKSWAKSATKAKADVALVVIGAWEVLDLKINSFTFAFNTSPADTMFRTQMQRGIDALRATGATVALLEVACMRPVDSKGGPVPALPQRGDDARTRHLNDLLREIAAPEDDGVFFVSGPTEWCTDPTISTSLSYRWDGVHAYKPGAKLIFETIATSILQLPVTK
ncbi:MAG: acyltransferase family protein [Actinomycetota bacterium]